MKQLFKHAATRIAGMLGIGRITGGAVNPVPDSAGGGQRTADG